MQAQTFGIELKGSVPSGPEGGLGVMAGELQRRTGRAVVAANYYGQKYGQRHRRRLQQSACQ